ncbi:RAD57 DNA repair protein RAD57 [Candida maltosa Xu316]|uniref:RecA family profile 1 domain-containing protein n=1 Tax=Candida maltosa (strain Xu316) TaxID=1245528 RepID=M3K554_CANMX|nr:hypothetical protein G210_5198 [Candida maltosa Xu316]
MDDYKQLGPGPFSCSSKFPFLTSLLQNHGKSINDLLQYHDASDHIQLSRFINRPIKEIDDYYKSLEHDLQLTPNPIDSLFESEFISTGLPSIDQELGGGGVAIGEVTEIFGASGCGKSHFLFQLLANCSKQYPESENIHVSTESFLETKRLKEITNSTMSMDSISYIYCQDLESQDHILYTQIPLKLKQMQGKTKLLVIDSIAQHFRREDSIMNSTYLRQKLESQELELAEDRLFQDIKNKQSIQLKKFHKTPKYASRTAKLYYVCQLYQHLTKLAQEYNIAVVLINQVSDFTLHQNRSLSEATEDELGYPLNLDFQTSIFSGWDGSSIYQNLPTTNVGLNYSEISTLEAELLRSFDANSDYKRQKTPTPNGGEVSAPVPAPHAQFEKQKDLIVKTHELRNRGTKNIVPTLGYPWAARIKNRIMLMKTYKPILKSRQELSEDLVSEQEKVKLNENGKRTNDALDQSASLIKGWQVERFAKVVCSTNNYNVNRFKKYQFVINKQGLIEV